MKNRKILNLIKEMLELVETQRDALLGGRFEEALAMQERRQKIVDEIQEIDSRASFLPSGINKLVGKNDHKEEDFSQQIHISINKILSIDREIEDTIQAEIASISCKLDNIQKLKAFCHTTPYRKTAKNLSTNV